MLTNLQVAVIGGDARQLEVIRKLIQLDANLFLVGFDQLEHGFSGATKLHIDEVDFNQTDAVILPVSGTNVEGEVETIFSNEKIVLTEEHLKQTPRHTTVFSGISNDYLDRVTKKSERRLVKLFERDDVAIYNSIPTVEGTIMMVIQHTDITIHNSNVVIIGLGRTGMSLARSFAALGANVKVGARRTEHIARIMEMGLEPFDMKDLSRQVSDADVCLNTAPSHVLNASVISHMPPRTLIIDIASKPGGTDFRYAEKRGIKALLAPGLPGIVAPKTAGQIIAKVLTQLLGEIKKEREESSHGTKR